MELWIRSQDRKYLARTGMINIAADGRTIVDDIPKFHYLGTYKTKERALEVLDEIQKLIEPKTLINVENFNTNDARILCDKFKEYSPVIVGNDNIKIEPLGFIVYEMPKE